jgi:2-octaprenylphenol hydroxylase
MKELDYDVIIVGAGIAGLTLAVMLGQHQFSVAILEKKSLPANANFQVSAIHLAGQKLLNDLDVWPRIKQTSYSAMRNIVAWDALGGGQIEFDSADINEGQLGFIVENAALEAALYQRLLDFKNVEIHAPAHPEHFALTAANVSMSCNAREMTASLLVGADGANSWVQQQAEMTISKRPYHQEAVVAWVQSTKPHQETGYQNFLATGPLALLPLHAPQQEAFIWSTSSEHASKLLEMPEQTFNLELSNAMENRLGALELLSERKKITLYEQHAQNYVKERVALIGDAAHRIHPLAGQGANLGLLDAYALSQSLLEARKKDQDLGALRTLRRYERIRYSENERMLLAMRYFKEAFAAQNPVWITARSFGMSAVNRCGFLKKYLMRYAAGLALQEMP